jgi:hypothetical protein
VPAPTWTRTVCQDVVGYLKDTSRREARLEAATRGTVSPAVATATFVAYLHAVAARTDRLVASLKRRGVPRVAGGAAAAAAITASFASLRDTLRATATDAARLPANDPAAFGAAFVVLQGRLADRQHQDQAAFQAARQLQPLALAEADATQPACQQLAKLS